MVTQSQPVPMHAPESAYARLLQPPPPPTADVGDGSAAATTTELLTLGDSTTHHVYYNLTSMPENTCSTSMYQGESPIVSSGVGMELQPAALEKDLLPRKRKSSFSKGSDLDDDLMDDAKSFRTNEDNKKQNHSEIEKRRRDKMNTYITELSAMVPMCHAMSRKLDKLTVLRMAVQHLKTIRGAAVHSYTEGHYKPAFLSDQELKTLILQAAEGFLFVVGCDRGRILYVSESVSQILNYSQGDLLGQSWFDILHPKDVAKVKEQLSSPDLNPRERLIDAKTMLPVRNDVPHGGSRLCPGARRSFFCRMKCKLTPQIKEEADTTTGGCPKRKKHQNPDRKYSVIQCTGYLKSWTPAKMGLDEQEPEVDGEACNLSCLVAVGREQPPFPPRHFASQNTTVKRPPLRSIQFISRHAIDGKFLFIDQRATLVLGFLPQELLGTSMYEHYHNDDISHLAEAHKAALQTTQSVNTQLYRFRSRNGCFVKLQSEWKSFRNPWTKDIEYLVGKNSVIISDSDSRLVESSILRPEEISHSQGTIDFFNQTNGGKEMQRLITSHVEVSKIGKQIAEQVLDMQRRNEDSSFTDSPNSDSDPIVPNETSPGFVEVKLQLKVKNSDPHAIDRLKGIQTQHPSLPGGGNINSTTTENEEQAFQCRNNNGHLSMANNSTALEAEEDMMEMINTPLVPQSPNNSVTNDGNDEAAMAVIMSLLEADAGLGGPVDFSGLPWPLP